MGDAEVVFDRRLAQGFLLFGFELAAHLIELLRQRHHLGPLRTKLHRRRRQLLLEVGAPAVELAGDRRP